MSFPLVGNLSDLFGILKKDAGQASMTEIRHTCGKTTGNCEIIKQKRGLPDTRPVIFLY
jgi:hypothetical protein